MTRPQVVVTLLLAGALLTSARAASAQGPESRYRPSRPTLSPWFDLYQRNSGPLDNYHQFVRPQIELQDTLTQQNAAIQRGSAGLRSLRSEVTDLQQEGNVRPTGTGSVFMDYSHFYPSKQSAGRTAGAAGRQRTWKPPPPRSSHSSMGSVRGRSGL